jgi:hypothetical protein
MLTPNHVVTTARAVLVAGALTAAVLMLGPWPGLEQVFGLSDKAAHAIAFGGLVAVSFLAFPRMRRNDLAVAAVMLGASVEVAQLFTADRSASIGDLLADTAGVGVVYLASHIENLAPWPASAAATFAEIAAQDRRRGARRLAPVIQAAFPSPRRRDRRPPGQLRQPGGPTLSAPGLSLRPQVMRLTLTGSLPGKLSSRPSSSKASWRLSDTRPSRPADRASRPRPAGSRPRGNGGVEMLVLVPDLAVGGHVGGRGAGAVREVAAVFFFFVAKDHGSLPFFARRAS